MSSDKKGFTKDEASCEEKLGKSPPLPPQPQITMAISESVAERIKTGAVDEERLRNYDNYWIEKLACMDKNHTIRNNLDIFEAEKIMKGLLNFVHSGRTKSCPIDRNKITDCFEMYEGHTLRCESEVAHFIGCVDRLLYDTVRKEFGNVTPNKKMSYAERFHRGY
ncbi:uncharacterized protein LOC107272310 [Cephus cinctus]|uniref:Uncharacterized protein LOC107272310 n=1 Tax=Cephus cinctus TaxID=211228 RepID=A0AAJ7RRV8_CEPCN|nr:uncharacterized protein LOC107272310 [Cephus cinctus]